MSADTNLFDFLVIKKANVFQVYVDRTRLLITTSDRTRALDTMDQFIREAEAARDELTRLAAL